MGRLSKTPSPVAGPEPDGIAVAHLTFGWGDYPGGPALAHKPLKAGAESGSQRFSKHGKDLTHPCWSEDGAAPRRRKASGL